jgi:2-polyprenyl-6-hydroxyphenyl methylase/3-demethylubiquinone-9 3-methyltransferase
MNREAVPAVAQLKGLRILDVGCGGGLLSESLARLGANVVGIDPSQSNIEVARNHSASTLGSLANREGSYVGSIEYRCTTIEDMARADEKFDVICALEVIEHVEDLPTFLKSISSCLKDGVMDETSGDIVQPSSIFISTINRTSKSYALAILGAEYLMRKIPIGTHDWRKFVTPSELDSLIASNNMKRLEIKGLVPEVVEAGRFAVDSLLNRKTSDQKVCKYNPDLRVVLDSVLNGPTSSWCLSEDDIDVNYIIHGVKK